MKKEQIEKKFIEGEKHVKKIKIKSRQT